MRPARATVMMMGGLALMLSALSCNENPPAGSPETDSGNRQVIRLATTTSTENSGLLERLLPFFEQWWGAPVHVIAVGTGRALNLGRNGDVDAVLVHDPAAEEAFVAEGYGINRRLVMYNDFLLLGPKGDPAEIGQASGPPDALKRIAQAESAFVSRGDNSATHKREMTLWKAADLEPTGDWYLEAGQGMSATLLMADERGAYCLSDRGTYLAMRGKLRLEPLFEDPEALENPYSIIAVNPAVHRKVNYRGAMALVAWVTSPEGQKIIGDFRVDDAVLFHPLAVPPKQQGDGK
ncbi:MAG: substrate-binding domain-containing protein [Phycisphaerae bacterium]